VTAHAEEYTEPPEDVRREMERTLTLAVTSAQTILDTLHRMDEFFRRALTTLKARPAEVISDAAPVYPAVLDALVPGAWHDVERHASNRVEADHSQLKQRLRPMRGLRDRPDRDQRLVS